MKYNRKKLPELDKTNTILFWGHRPRKDGKIGKSCFSQWWLSNFIFSGMQFCCAEQWMMAQKAALFNDKKILESILDSTSPKEMKSLGKKINRFNENTWNENKYSIVLFGSYLKFSQNSQLKSFLLETEDTVIVEASPYDKIWGIGLKAEDPDAYNPEKWNGENLLGFALMEVRDAINSNQPIHSSNFI